METVLIGREAELAALDALLDRIPLGTGAVTLVGSAGAGKTALWEAGVARARARGYRVLAARGAPPDRALAFSAIGDLLDGVLNDVLPVLPAPQRRALAIALLLSEAPGNTPGERAVAVAFLGALRLLACEPIVLAVDDIQWLDPSSAAVIAFAARRLSVEPVGLLLSLRPEASSDGFAVAETVRVDVPPLDLDAVHRLVHSRLGIILSRPALRRLHAISHGNPLFSLELARVLDFTGSGLRGVDLPGTLREVVESRLARLPDETRLPLAAAAAAADPTVPLLGEVTGEGVEGLLPAVAAQVVTLSGDRIEFVHPLYAAGAYALVDERRRRALHRALAAAVDDPEERARQLALSTEGPDEDVASTLVDAVISARERGATAVAAELAERALELTPRELVKHVYSRSLAAAELAFEAGDPARARALLDDAAVRLGPGPDRARVLALRARVELFAYDLRRASELYAHALAEADGVPATLQQLHQGVAWSLLLRRSELPLAAEHARTAVALAEEGDDPVELADALAALAQAELLLGDASGDHALDRALGVDLNGLFPRVLREPAVHRGLSHIWRDELDAARACYAEAQSRTNARGDDSSLAYVLMRRAEVELLDGRWHASERALEEGLEIAMQTGQRPVEAGLTGLRALLHAHRGDEEGTRATARRAFELADEHGSMQAWRQARIALGLLELSLGDAAAAWVALEPVVEQTRSATLVEPGENRFLADAVEALTLVGRPDEAESVLAWLAAPAERLERRSAQALAARGRALLAFGLGDAGRAVALLDLALAQHERATIPFERARTQLVFGSVQRRLRRQREARSLLAAALAGFESLGASLWAGRARAELGSVGGRIASGNTLTPAELRVAALVVEGRTNREVASALFLAERTVEGHLSRIYGKLGIRSRTELARRVRL